MALVTQLAEAPAPYSGGGIPKGIVIVIALAALYVLPALLAWQRGNRQRGRIILINLLLGWTIVGWAVAMILTFRYEPPPDGEVDVPHQPGA